MPQEWKSGQIIIIHEKWMLRKFRYYPAYNLFYVCLVFILWRFPCTGNYSELGSLNRLSYVRDEA